MTFAGLNKDETKMEKSLVTRKDNSNIRNLDAAVPLSRSPAVPLSLCPAVESLQLSNRAKLLAKHELP